jgi:hypothetical protein
MITQEESDSIFAARLWASETGRKKVAGYLMSMGYAIKMDAMRLAPTHAEWRQFVDNGDLHITARIEVKQRKFDFTSAKDFPFQDGLIVCSCSSFARAEREGSMPFAYVHLNLAGSHVAVISTRTRPTWKGMDVGDSEYETVRRNWCVPLSQVKFGSLQELAGMLFLETIR